MVINHNAVLFFVQSFDIEQRLPVTISLNNSNEGIFAACSMSDDQ